MLFARVLPWETRLTCPMLCERKQRRMTVLGNGKTVSDWTDEARRHVGRGLDALGLGPDETPYRVVGEWTAARLRAYHPKQTSAGPVVLIIPAPFKRAYIWDLLPPVSVVR